MPILWDKKETGVINELSKWGSKSFQLKGKDRTNFSPGVISAQNAAKMEKFVKWNRLCREAVRELTRGALFEKSPWQGRPIIPQIPPQKLLIRFVKNL
jgi:hypothetical protein